MLLTFNIKKFITPIFLKVKSTYGLHHFIVGLSVLRNTPLISGGSMSYISKYDLLKNFQTPVCMYMKMK